MENFKNALNGFVNGCQKLCDDYMKQFEGQEYKLTVTCGKRYAKINRTGFMDNKEGQTSVHCFVDIDNGDILKAASWKAPQKNGKRGNIFDENFGLVCMNEHGTKYIR